MNGYGTQSLLLNYPNEVLEKNILDMGIICTRDVWSTANLDETGSQHRK
jgi:hypothetical protein